MVYGYMGKVLRIDLTTKEISTQTFSEEILKKFIGGSGLGAKILYDETSADTDPLGAENRLIFMTGPLTGTPVVNCGRYEVIAKSPLTGIYGQSNSGGTWGMFLKRSGYDGVVFKGKSANPVYIWINEGDVEIRDAANVWGKDTFETDEHLKKETHPKAVIASIGQAGEKLVRIAGIINDGTDGRAAARCGLGAVMGSKNLKSVVVYGTKKPEVYDISGIKASVKELAPEISAGMEFFSMFGTAGVIVPSEAEGDLPVKNWKSGTFTEGAKKINGDVIVSTILKSKYNCHGCIIGCGKTIKVESGLFETVETGAPEYETIGMFGSNCLVDNIEAVAKANELCNRYGLDTISTGGVISFAMELYEQGIITKQQTGGLELNWGNAEAMVEMVKKIGLREDIGWLLGEGSKRAAEAIGGYASEYAVHVKGMEFPAHDPRCKFSNALAYAVSERGACHLSAFSYPFENGASIADLGYPKTLERFSSEGKGEFVAKLQNLMSLLDSLSSCKFTILGLVDKTIKTYTNWLNYVTGWNLTSEEFLETGERILNIKRMYSCKCGMSRKHDVLPPRILSHPRPDGDAAGKLANFGEMLNDYYKYRGWSELGIPLTSTLERLGI